MKNALTFNILDSRCLQAAGLQEGSIHPLVRQSIVNDKLFRIYEMLDGLDDPFYDRAGVLTVAADQEYLAGSDLSGVITLINSTAHTITRTNGSFIAGSLISVTLFNPSTSDLYQFLAVVLTGGLVATYTVVSGNESQWPVGATEVFVAVVKTLSALTANLSGVYVKDILKVWDNGGPSGAVRVFDPVDDASRFQYLAQDYFHLNRVAWHFRGDILQFDVGKNARPLGIVQYEYRGKPGLFSDATIDNAIDIPPEQNEMLTSEVTAEFLTQTRGQIPPELAARINQYKPMYDAASADKAKA